MATAPAGSTTQRSPIRPEPDPRFFNIVQRNADGRAYVGVQAAAQGAVPAIVATAHRQRQAVVPLSGLVFTTGRGTPLDPQNVLRAFRAAVLRANLPRQRFHDLRHAYATLALQAGEGINAVSRALGHASIATTADIYGHWTPAMAQRLADRMDEVLAR